MKESKIAKEENAFKTALLLLPSRLFLFLAFQLLLAWLLGSFAESQKYWLLTASATNLVSITILVWLLKSERKRFFPLFHFDRKTLKRDIFTFLGITLLCGPVVFGPEYFLSRWIWSDPSIPFNMMFQPISRSLIYVLAVVFPVTIALAELSTYFVFIMPRLNRRIKQKWMVVLLPVLFLAIQHCTLPFIPDINFVLYRGLVFLPFAGLIGITLYFRPTLFPYFAILHGLLDFGTVMVLLNN